MNVCIQSPPQIQLYGLLLAPFYFYVCTLQLSSFCVCCELSTVWGRMTPLLQPAAPYRYLRSSSEVLLSGGRTCSGPHNVNHLAVIAFTFSKPVMSS